MADYVLESTRFSAWHPVRTIGDRDWAPVLTG